MQGGITYRDKIVYFSKFNNNSVGRIKNLYLKWVAEHGAQCEEALKLSALFSACIDGERTEIPDKLLSAPEPSEATNNFIVNRLIAECLQFKRRLVVSSLHAVPSQSIPQQLWDSLVFDSCFQGLSYFEVFRFIQRCTQLNDDQKMVLYLGIDFATFSVTEREFSKQVCPQLGNLLHNALYQSHLLLPKAVDHFNLSNLGQWKRLYSSDVPGPALQERISDAMSMFARKLIVVRAGPQLVVSLLFTERFEYGLNAMNEVCVFSTNHKLFRSHAVLKGYCLDLDQHLLQIYKSGKRNTFIWMSTAVNQNERSKGLVGRVSIDLRRLGNKAENQFDLITKQPLRQVEIFVLASDETRDLEVRHFPIASTDKGVYAPAVELRAGNVSCRDYCIYSEQDWLQSPTASPQLVEVVRHHGELGLIQMNAYKMKELLTQTSKYHLSDLATNIILLFPDFALEALPFLPALPCLAIPLFLLGLGPQELILQSLLRCLNDSCWRNLALENIFKLIPDIDIVPQLEFFCLGSCTSPHATELREWLSACHAQASECQPEIRAALGVFVDLQCSLQDVFHEQRDPTLTFLRLAPKEDKAGFYEADQTSESVSPSRRGDVFLFRAMQPPSNLPNYQWPDFIGVVQDMDNHAILFDFRFSWCPYEIKDVDWQATHLGNVTTSRTMWEALSKDSMSCGPLDSSCDFKLQQNNTLNTCQCKAIEMAINQQVSLIWGPPGTGKSSTAVNLISCLSQRGERVLVAASTHQAVDNLLRKFVDLLPSDTSHEYIVRCGDINDVDPKCRRWTFDMHPLMKHRDAHRASKVVKKILKEARIVFSTVTASGLGVLRSDDKFDTVVIDEAGQVTYANTRIATSKAQHRVVLIGDHKQLNATVHEQSKEFKFEQSMFEQLLIANYPCTMLDVQYRMHPSLIEFCSNKFYEGKISSGSSVRHIQPLKSYPWGGSHHIVFVDVAIGHEKRVNGTSFMNEIEAEYVCRQVRFLLEKKECKPEDIGIITGYSAQVQCISRRLSSTSVTVRTVDGFQGQERRVIIFSAVRTMKNIGFLKDKNRMNVMFTRAKQGLVVFGREATMKLDPLWKDWLQVHARVSAK